MHSQLPKLAEYSARTIEIGRITRTTLDLDAESKPKKALTFRSRKASTAGSVIELQPGVTDFRSVEYLRSSTAGKSVSASKGPRANTAKVDPYSL